MFTIYAPDGLDDGLTRGGPVVKRRGYRFNQLFVATDARKRISVSTNPNYLVRNEGPDQYNLNASITWKPTSSVQVSAGPGFNKSPSLAQFVTSGSDSTATNFYGRRYIFAQIDQRQLSMTTRANIVFSPTLTLEAFAQPLIASGDYKTFREFTNPREATFNDFRPGVELHSTVVDGRRIYTVDADGPGTRAQPISFGDPNFNFRSLRGRAVMRWEYRPGSTVFFVWQQNRSDIDPVGDFSFSRDRSALFDARPDNIFLIKASYWLAF